MANDALDPGPSGDYPHFPRNKDGTPNWEQMPTGTRTSMKHRDASGRPITYDVTPTDDAGTPIDPPPIP